MKKYFLLAILAVVTILISCKEGVATPDDSNAIPGRRDYTWVADTINNPFLHFINIWGNSTNNIWTGGVIMSDGLYRYNGNKWSLDNRVYISDPVAVWGYENSVWIGNDQGCIWKFISSDKSFSQELTDYKIDDNLTMFSAMAGTSNNEIYAAGCNHTPSPIIMKYKDGRWSLDKKLLETGGFSQIIYSSRNDRYYLVLNLNDYSTQVFEYDRKTLKKIYEYPPSNGSPTISIIDGYLYIAIDKKIYRYFNSNTELIFEVNDANFGGVVWGRNRNDVFIRMQDGIAHYNGTDWKYLYKSPEAVMLAPNCALFSNEVFIPAKIRRTGYPIIYHGKLK